MPSWIEPPPKQRKAGCLGKGCLMLVVFLVLLAVAFFVGGYVGVRYVVTSTTPKEIPQIETTEAEQETVRHRWEEFKPRLEARPSKPRWRLRQRRRPSPRRRRLLPVI